MASENLSRAKATKNDEFYTLYDYIQKEVNAYLEFDPDVFQDKVVLLPCDDPEWSNFTRFFAQNFENFRLKKLISTSYAADSKPEFIPYQISLFESEAPQFDESKTRNHGKIFTLTRDKNQSGKIDIDDLEWDYLKGDGDFRSEEIKALRDEADIIVTNPPFSKFWDFLAWIVGAGKKFLIVGNMNAITYKEVFSLIKENRLWLGATCNSEDMVFAVPEGAIVAPQDREKAARLGYVGNYTRLGNACWYTNLDHGRRHQPLSLMTMADNIKFSKHKEIRGKGYLKYDNYDAIDVPFTDAIPADYGGVMGVPITYLDKYCPEQFEILGRRGDLIWAETECDFYTPPSVEMQQKYKAMNKTWRVQNTYILNEDGIPQITYGRIFIRIKEGVDKPRQLTYILNGLFGTSAKVSSTTNMRARGFSDYPENW